MRACRKALIKGLGIARMTKKETKSLCRAIKHKSAGSTCSLSSDGPAIFWVKTAAAGAARVKAGSYYKVACGPFALPEHPLPVYQTGSTDDRSSRRQ